VIPGLAEAGPSASIYQTNAFQQPEQHFHQSEDAQGFPLAMVELNPEAGDKLRGG
jgi:hypothetical protein